MVGEKTRIQQAMASLDAFREEAEAAGLEGDFAEHIASARDAVAELQSKVEASDAARDNAFYYEVTK